MKIPTDLKILKTIYKVYYNEFTNFDKKRKERRLEKNFVPIDVNMIGKKLGVDGDIIFSRLKTCSKP